MVSHGAMIHVKLFVDHTADNDTSGLITAM